MAIPKKYGTRGGWVKTPSEPVLGGNLGTCFDVSMLHEGGIFKMYFSWRDIDSLAYTESLDGLNWSEPVVILSPRETPEQWENSLNRPSILHKDGIFHLWYTGQYHWDARNGTSHIFYATSTDGIHFTRNSDRPVLYPDTPWEQTSVMNPCVLWDEKQQRYLMWYSAGAQYEPCAIGFASSTDGIHWEKASVNPVFQADPNSDWEFHKTAGCQVLQRENDFLMFYIGYYDEDYAQIGMACSADGIHDWKRAGCNPIIAPTEGGWDGEACYKPFVISVGNTWHLWYNGRKGLKEQIGHAIHEGLDLGL